MSYILDALKKAERERGLTRVPNLGSVHAELPERGRGRWVVFAAGVAALGALLWAFYPGGNGMPSPVPRAQEAPPEALRPKASGVSVPEAPAGDIPGAGRGEESSPWRETPAAAAVLPPVPRRVDPPAPGLPETQNPPASAATPASATTPVAAAPDVPLRDAVAGMILSVHMYSERPEDRMVFLNGRRYVEGDLVEKRYLLESITPEGAVLRLGGERETVRPGN